tara:strand:- start:205428 stop:207659 length:2232 start_codon:yes stop_codon:yes gene_type:complete
LEDQYQLQYVLNIKGKKFQDEIPVEWDQFTIGSSERSDLCIEDQKLAPIHIKFRVQNDVLTATNLGGDKATSIGWQKLNHGKMYILDSGDKISLGSLKVQISQVKVEYVPEDEEELDEIDEEVETEIEDLDDVEEEDEEEVELDDDQTDPNLTPMIPEESDEEEDEVDEVDEEDEDDESTEPDRTPAKKLPQLGANKKLNIKKSKGSYSPKGPLPGPISRLSFLLLNISLVVMLKFFFFHHFELNQLWNTQWKNFSSLILGNVNKYYPVIEPFLPKDIGPIVKNPIVYEMLVLYILLCTVSGILFGKSLGAFLGFCFSDGNFITTRIKALVRGIFSIVTSPFLIFDLPLLIGKRSLKEVLSGTRFYFPNTFLKLVSAPLVIIFTIVIFMTPLVLFIDQVEQNITISEYAIAKSKNFGRKSKKKPTEISTRSIHLNGKIKTFISNYWEFLPTLSSNKKGVKLSTLLLDTQKNMSVVIKVLNKKEDISTEFKIWNKYDPLLKVFNNELSQEISKLQKDKASSSPIFSKTIINSLKINTESAPFLPQHFGPFIANPLILKKNIVEKWPELQSYQVSTFEKSNAYLFALESPKISIIKVIQGNQVRTIEIKPNKKSRKLAKDAIRNFILQIDFFNSPKSTLKDTTGWSKALDIFAKLSQAKNNQHGLSSKDNQFLSQYYLKQAMKAYKEDNAPLKEALIENIKSTEKALLFFISKSKDSQLQKFRLTIIRIQKALSDGDAKFFESNK